MISVFIVCLHPHIFICMCVCEEYVSLDCDALYE